MRIIFAVLLALGCAACSDCDTTRLRSGMTEGDVLSLCQVPDERIITVKASTKYEKWIYDHDFLRPRSPNLYFENGKLASWQATVR